jgi:cytochrome c-type biogenesis protein CcmH/NrfF
MYEDVIEIINNGKDVNSRAGITSLCKDSYGDFFHLDSPLTIPNSSIVHYVEERYTYRFPFNSGTHVY